MMNPMAPQSLMGMVPHASQAAQQFASWVPQTSGFQMPQSPMGGLNMLAQGFGGPQSLGGLGGLFAMGQPWRDAGLEDPNAWRYTPATAAQMGRAGTGFGTDFMGPVQGGLGGY